MSLSLSNPCKTSKYLVTQYLPLHGQLLLDHLQGQRRRGDGRQVARKMPKLRTSIPLPLPCLLHPLFNRSLRYPHRQIPSLLPHPSPLPPFQEKLPLAASHFNFVKGFSSLTDYDSGSETEREDGSGENVLIEEVDKVCKVIDELFALDRNMEAVLDECGAHLTHDLVVEVLRRFRHARKPALRFFNWAGRRPGFTHDSRTYNAIMGVLAKTRQFETMVSLLEEMGEKRVLSMETFEICIRAFAAGKERKKAVGVFELMKRYKFDVDVESFNTLLDSLGRAKLGKEAQVLFAKLEGRFVLNMRTYTVLLNGWCRVKDLMEAGRVWNEMVDKGFKPDIVAHNVMLDGLLRCKKRSDAIKLLEVMKAKGPCPDVQSYTLLIRDLCKQMKVEEAVEYFDEMVDNGCKPDAAVYTCLITGFGNKKRMHMVCELLKEMEDKGCPPDGLTYNALIKLLTSQKMPDDAVKIFKKMTHSGIEPSIHSYNMIMKSYFRMRNYEMGHAVWEEMNTKGCCPDDNSYTILIRGLISQGKSGEACKYLEEMLEKGMKAPLLDYNKFAADFSRGGRPDVLEELAQKMKSHGKFDASITFTRWAEKMKKCVKGREPTYRHYDQFAKDQQYANYGRKVAKG